MDNQEMLDAMRQLIREETTDIIREETARVFREETVKIIREETTKIVREETTKIIDEKLEPIRDEISGIKVIIDTEIRRDINLLAEGQAAILARLPDPAEMEDVQERLSAAEAVLKVHSQEIHRLKLAQ